MFLWKVVEKYQYKKTNRIWSAKYPPVTQSQALQAACLHPGSWESQSPWVWLLGQGCPVSSVQCPGRGTEPGTWRERQEEETRQGNPIRGLTEENTQLSIISPIGYFKSLIGDIFSNWGLVICSLTLRYQTNISPIPNWVYYPQLVIWDSQLGKYA